MWESTPFYEYAFKFAAPNDGPKKGSFDTHGNLIMNKDFIYPEGYPYETWEKDWCRNLPTLTRDAVLV